MRTATLALTLLLLATAPAAAQLYVGIETGSPVISEVGGLFLFAGAHLHASIPNFSGKTRFSIDFRTVNLDDTREMRGAPTHDVACTNSSIGDFRRAADLADMPDNIISAMTR